MLDEIFKDGKYDLPIELDKRDLKSELSAKLASYIKDLQKCEANDGVVVKVKNFKNLCELALEFYFRGIHSQAYKYFDDAVSELNIGGSPLLSATLGNELLFRGRVNNGMQDYTTDEMFHIPLNCRRIVRSQRYSFPGLPCLYLASSAYTCWMEMGRPSLDTFQVAALQPLDAEAKIIDLSRVPQQLATLRAGAWFKEEDYLLYWPLLAVCSIRVQGEDEPFKPEYIFPQFFLERILQTESNYKGIRYASIKCKLQFSGNWHTFTNYVFPTSTENMEESKDKSLASLFEFKSNRSGRELQILSPMQRMEWARTKDQTDPSEAEAILDSMKSCRIFTGDGKAYPYHISDFGMIELALRRESFDFEENPYVINSITSEEVDRICV